uniref:NADH dehydrogenase subunit 2 n=1 Tax=Pheidole flavigaster TaxID=3045141 RepID=UPI00257E1722|nr:NADH dehydrogenase subunit 2 [Pheidole flavigaster]WGV34152.1 NADH dehydrogenase subunit 2 [Pheidole flavigaster]
MIMFLNYFIMPNMLILPLISLFLTDFILIWFLLEISNFLFICTLNLSMNNKKMIFFYFIIQIMPSFIIMFFIIFNIIISNNNLITFILILALMMKLSIPPLHLWLPLLAKFMPWNMLLILLTFQKIIPFYLFSMIAIPYLILFLVIISCSILPPYMMLNMTNFKMLMSYSSLNQTSWMILLIYMKNIIWLKYFLFYSMIIFSLFTIMHYHKMIMSYNYSKSYFKFNILLIILMFNISGLPPFSFFFIKWFSMFIFMKSSNMLIILMMMMLSSLAMLFIYVNMMITLFFINKLKSKLISFTYPIPNWLTLIYFTSLFLSSLIFII